MILIVLQSMHMNIIFTPPYFYRNINNKQSNTLQSRTQPVHTKNPKRRLIETGILISVRENLKVREFYHNKC